MYSNTRKLGSNRLVNIKCSTIQALPKVADIKAPSLGVRMRSFRTPMAILDSRDTRYSTLYTIQLEYATVLEIQFRKD